MSLCLCFRYSDSFFILWIRGSCSGKYCEVLVIWHNLVRLPLQAGVPTELTKKKVYLLWPLPRNNFNIHSINRISSKGMKTNTVPVDCVITLSNVNSSNHEIAAQVLSDFLECRNPRARRNTFKELRPSRVICIAFGTIWSFGFPMGFLTRSRKEKKFKFFTDSLRLSGTILG